ncbi:MAG: glycoside hydrolase family 127 protein, partial [Firmicutes bacterium]|nr:glycoside hydrolase family 127 protein [Bacillota bacterium]
YRHVLPKRPEWYACACCPPNVSRLLTSLGQYAWGQNKNGIFIHLYIGGEASFEDFGKVSCESNYPWSGNMRYTVSPKTAGAKFSFAIRIPAWCNNWSVSVNGSSAEYELKDGYAYIYREWNCGDIVELSLSTEPRRIYANTNVRANVGCVAVMRGPLVYCLEEVDNGSNLSALRLPRASEITAKTENIEFVGNVVVLEAEGTRLQSCDELYSTTPPESKPALLRAVPYYTWGNRVSGGMRVWIHE